MFIRYQRLWPYATIAIVTLLALSILKTFWDELRQLAHLLVSYPLDWPEMLVACAELLIATAVLIEAQRLFRQAVRDKQSSDALAGRALVLAAILIITSTAIRISVFWLG